MHILFLENKIQELNNSLTQHQHSPVDRGKIEAQIQMLITGLAHYREALRIEEAFRRDNPAPIQNPAKPD